MLKKKDTADLTSKVAKQRKLQSNGHLTNLQKHAASTGVYLEIVRVGQTFFYGKLIVVRGLFSGLVLYSCILHTGTLQGGVGLLKEFHLDL